jgi:serine/threonine protein kinase
MVSTVHAATPKKYEMQQVIGRGSYGVVWRARDVTTGKLVAVKAIKRKSLVTADARNQFAREVGALAAIQHRNVVAFEEVFEDAAHVYIVTELCGQELYEHITELGRIPEARSRQIVRQMLHAVAHLHEVGFVHRDVKPENFCLDTKSGLVKLIDFGLCCQHEDRVMANRCGSYFYVAPEVLDRHYFGGSCDVWSVGVVLFVMLAGYPPFYGETDDAIAARVRAQPVDLSHERWQGVSAAAKDLVLRLLAKDPLRRPSAADALAHPGLDDGARRSSRRSSRSADHCQSSSSALTQSQPQSQAMPSLTLPLPLPLSVPGKLLARREKRRRSRSLELGRSATDEQPQPQHGECACPPQSAAPAEEEAVCTAAELSSLQCQLEGCQLHEQSSRPVVQVQVQADPAAAAVAYPPQQPSQPCQQKQSRGARFRRSFRRRINFAQPNPGQP